MQLWYKLYACIRYQCNNLSPTCISPKTVHCTHVHWERPRFGSNTNLGSICYSSEHFSHIIQFKCALDAVPHDAHQINVSSKPLSVFYWLNMNWPKLALKVWMQGMHTESGHWCKCKRGLVHVSRQVRRNKLNTKPVKHRTDSLYHNSTHVTKPTQHTYNVVPNACRYYCH